MLKLHVIFPYFLYQEVFELQAKYKKLRMDCTVESRQDKPA